MGSSRRSGLVRIAGRPHERGPASKGVKKKKAKKLKLKLPAAQKPQPAAAAPLQPPVEGDMFGLALSTPAMTSFAPIPAAAASEPAAPPAPAFADASKEELFRSVVSNTDYSYQLHPADQHRQRQIELKKQAAIRRAQKNERFITKAPKPL